MIMKKLIIPSSSCSAFISYPDCTKWADDKSKYLHLPGPAAANGISDSTPLCGSVKGTMLTGKTYTLGCTINVPAGDTLILQQGVTVNANINSGIIVHGTMISLGTQAQPNYLTVPGVAKNTTPNLPSSRTPPTLACGRHHVRYLLSHVGAQMDASRLRRRHLRNVDGPAVEESSGTSFNILFQNPNGYFIMEDSWYGAGRMTASVFLTARSTCSATLSKNVVAAVATA